MNIHLLTKPYRKWPILFAFGNPNAPLPETKTQGGEGGLFHLLLTLEGRIRSRQIPPPSQSALVNFIQSAASANCHSRTTEHAELGPGPFSPQPLILLKYCCTSLWALHCCLSISQNYGSCCYTRVLLQDLPLFPPKGESTVCRKLCKVSEKACPIQRWSNGYNSFT